MHSATITVATDMLEGAQSQAATVDPSVWVSLLQTMPLATICVVLFFVTRYLYKENCALHEKIISNEQAHQDKLEEMVSLLHDVNIVNLEKSFEASERWKKALEQLENGMQARFEDHLHTSETTIDNVNQNLINLDVLLQSVKANASTKIVDKVKDIEARLVEQVRNLNDLREALKRRREDIRDDHGRSRERMLLDIAKMQKAEHKPIIQEIEALKREINVLVETTKDKSS